MNFIQAHIESELNAFHARCEAEYMQRWENQAQRQLRSLEREWRAMRREMKRAGFNSPTRTGAAKQQGRQ